ncbi:hypothetical protein PMI11_05036 [Rhizobium sp. CF142]|nr:hypothetical protein PMI11_05036 [Rhizobium sp. CF142]
MTNCHFGNRREEPHSHPIRLQAAEPSKGRLAPRTPEMKCGEGSGSNIRHEAGPMIDQISILRSTPSSTTAVRRHSLASCRKRACPARLGNPPFAVLGDGSIAIIGAIDTLAAFSANRRTARSLVLHHRRIHFRRAISNVQSASDDVGPFARLCWQLDPARCPVESGVWPERGSPPHAFHDLADQHILAHRGDLGPVQLAARAVGAKLHATKPMPQKIRKRGTKLEKKWEGSGP